MRVKLKVRRQILKQKRWQRAVYIVLCILLVLCFSVTPLYFWAMSGIETRGVTSVRGDSMTPTFANNDILYYHPIEYKRGELVVVRCPENNNYNTSDLALLKRIVGLPGETVEITEEGVLIDGVLLEEEYTTNQDATLQETNDINEILLSDNEYFLLGDNRANSLDSRHVGAVHSIDFLYGLTIEPNRYTYQIAAYALLIVVCNILCIVGLATLILVMLTQKEYVVQTKNGKRLKITSAQPSNARHEAAKSKQISQPKSEKNKKKAARAAKAEKERLAQTHSGSGKKKKRKKHK